MAEDDFERAREAVLRMKESIPIVIRDTINANKEFIRKLQTETQFFQGEDSKGERIVPIYTPYTIRIKKSKGDPWDRVTFADTGKLYDTLVVEGLDDEYKIEFSPTLDYGRKLIEKYGSDVLGIQEDLITEFVNTFVTINLKITWDDILAG